MWQYCQICIVLVIYHLEPCFNVNSVMMFVLWSEWYMAIEKKKFLKILSRSRSKTRKLDNVKAKIQDNLNTMSKVLYIVWNHFLVWIQQWCPLSDWSNHMWQYCQICIVLVICHLEPCFNVNSVMMFVLWSEWLRKRSFSRYCQGQDPGQRSVSIHC